MKKVVVLYSGGLDSSVVLAQALSEPETEVLALTIDYGQANRRELECCRWLAEFWKFEHVVVSMSLLHNDPGKQIPARNTIFLARALEFALTHGADEVRYGAEPDSTYIDSSIAYIRAQAEVFKLHGVRLLAPVKALAGKLAVLERALDLGVPLDLVHSSLSNEVDGQCKTSNRYLAALAQLFPGIEPRVLLEHIQASHSYSNLRSYDVVVAPQSGSFKFLPALFSLAHWAPYPHEVEVFTTGNWGKSLTIANELLGNRHALKVTQTQDVNLLRTNHYNTDQKAAVWGAMQALSRLPRSQFMRGALHVRYTQGHLYRTLVSMGYEVYTASSLGPRVEVVSLITEG